mgnify:FL=1
MTTFNWQGCFAPLLDDLDSRGLERWRKQLQQQLQKRFDDNPHGDIARWNRALDTLPHIGDATANLNQSAITLNSDQPLSTEDRAKLEEGLRGLMPWRKGPFEFFGTYIDTERRSGCGSGYHCWRMLGEGAGRVIGIDPGLLFLFQFLSVKQYAGQEQRIDLLPVRVEDLPPKLEAFDTTFSMGVLYHRRSPLDHLLELKDTLRPGGELVLETLIADGPEGYSLMPEDRYGRMRNVWFLPSCDTLLRWLDRTGFRNARLVDVTETTIEEQRSTDWMQFQSLQDFLDPDDPTKTVEGYPGPKRATVIADKP